MRAIPLPHSRQKMQTLARELYVEHDWEMPRGFVSKDFTDPRNYTLAEWQQAKRARQDPERLKAMFQDCWATTDSQSALSYALQERGFVLARGDRRGVVAVDHEGEVYAVARWVGIKTKKVRERVSDAAALPDVRVAHRKAAEAVADRLQELRAQTGQKAKFDMAAFSSLKRALLDAHTKAARDMAEQQRQRAAAEQVARDARFRRGWRGLLDRVTGRHGKTKRQNAVEFTQSAQRDTAEMQTFLTQQNAETQSLTANSNAARRQALKDLSELRKDFQRITQNAAKVPDPPPVGQDRKRRRRQRNRPS